MATSDSEKDALALIESKSVLSNDLRKLRIQFDGVIDDPFLLHFIRGRKYNVEKAATSFKNYFKVRTSSTYRELFSKMDETESNKPLRSGLLKVLRERDDEGRQLIVIDFAFWPDNMDIDEFIRGVLYIVEECWNCSKTEKQGLSIIADLSYFGMTQLAFYHPYNAYKCVCMAWSNLPIRYSSIYLLNVGNIFSMCLNAAKHLFPVKFRDRLKVTPLSDLHKEIHPSKLPESMGGKLSEENAFDTDLVNRIFEKGEYYKKFFGGKSVNGTK